MKTGRMRSMRRTVTGSTHRGVERRKARRPPNDECPTCGRAVMHPHRGKLTLAVNGEAVIVPRCSYLLCPACGETVTDLEQTYDLLARGHALYRAKHHLLSPDEVHSIRERHGLTQAALARLLKLGANTISRWEAGRNVQSAAMDVLLRLIRDVPASLLYLRRHAA
jgi:HTH-type transcriptional regulator/antitoxin MqsA